MNGTPMADYQHGGQRSAIGVSLIFMGYNSKMGASTPTLSYNSPPMWRTYLLQLDKYLEFKQSACTPQYKK